MDFRSSALDIDLDEKSSNPNVNTDWSAYLCWLVASRELPRLEFSSDSTSLATAVFSSSTVIVGRSGSTLSKGVASTKRSISGGMNRFIA
jgi:hypothetical protein